MSQNSEPDRPPARGVSDLIRRRAEQRRGRLRGEIQRSRQGGHAVPTWVLTLVIVLIVVVFAYLIITVGST